MDYNIFTIIVTYNGQKWISKTLNSLAESVYTLNVIVVDNCSTDRTLDIIEKEYPDVKLIRLEKNLGFGQANNIGIQSALSNNADFVFLLNQDAQIKKGTVKDLLKPFSADDKIGIVSPVHLDGQGKNLDYGFREYINRGSPSNLGYNDLVHSSGIYICEFINAAAWLLSRACINKVGGFNPLFFHYGEDNDYVNRLHYFNLKLAVQSGAVIYHDRNQALDFSSLEKNAKMEEIAFLKIFVNINLSFTGICLKTLDKLLREAIYYAIHLKWKRYLGLLSGFSKALKKIMPSFKSRETSRQECAYLHM